jgi:hypothetical protein
MYQVERSGSITGSRTAYDRRLPDHERVCSKLRAAVWVLASRDEDVHERVRLATLHLAELQADDFVAADQREMYKSIMTSVTSGEPIGDEESIGATTRDMSPDQLQGVVGMIVGLAYAAFERPVAVPSDAR